METLRHLFSKVIVAIPILIIFMFLYWMIQKVMPISFSSTPNNSLSFWNNILPSPMTFRNGLLGNRTSLSADDNLHYYSTGEGYNGPINGNPNYSSPPKYNFENGLYIRNLSIYRGGHIYTGLTFTGEARSSMFVDGSFPLLIIDGSGRIISQEQVLASSQWSVPGWVRFYAKINGSLPVNSTCNLVFTARSGSYDSFKGVQISIPETCN